MGNLKFKIENGKLKIKVAALPRLYEVKEEMYTIAAIAPQPQ